MLDINLEIPLRLTMGECNTILAILSDQPWRIANPLIGKFHAAIAAVAPEAFGPPAPAKAAANGVDHAEN